MDLKHAQEPAPRRFTPEQLGRLLEIDNSIKCECPNQVARLVRELGLFEDYERGCANANAADQAVHQRLYDLAVAARRALEDALELVIEHDGLKL
ncbi:MAG: hypothetical protein JST54_24685 [Deltaproteobacteria bacterium]|nr:hypothetical protein [Deltaproteobacteria bacterium]